MTPILVVTTLGSAEDARRIARDVVARGLAACAQIEAIESFYVWKGAVQHEPEQRVTFKTSRAAWPAIEHAIRAAHPYELPAIHAVAMEAVHPPYARWIEENSRGG